MTEVVRDAIVFCSCRGVTPVCGADLWRQERNAGVLLVAVSMTRVVVVLT